ncbi:MAG: type I phosphomannose isomerase catalytic subunit [Bacteroidales bacterium]|jgi:mannose-6-phosphate isomerase|nr:type I phosphomannose isomerase catalytic subunit [Bacteroidales bacterium]
MDGLYPLKFKPIFKDKIWGGDKIRTVMGLDFSPLNNCGEAWMLSGVAGNPSIVSNGFLAGNELNELLEVYMYDLVGDEVYEKYGNEFPVLIKLIDANDWLSIQVHPDDELAARRKIGRGKTEMWYVLGADDKAQLISGFSQKLNQQAYLRHLENKTLPEVMNYERVAAGDVFFMPAGRVHALGPGVLLAEIQETSDTTYRIYDWDRLDDQGNSRELHIDEALEAIDFELQDKYRTDYREVPDQSTTLASCAHFTTNLVSLEKHALEKDYSALDSFVALLCTGGRAFVQDQTGQYDLAAGELILIPALTERVLIRPLEKTKLLEVHI